MGLQRRKRLRMSETRFGRVGYSKKRECSLHLGVEGWVEGEELFNLYDYRFISSSFQLLSYSNHPSHINSAMSTGSDIGL